jgi:hypothetical protein
VIHAGRSGSRLQNRAGRTLVEFVVALPILAMGGVAVAGLLLTGGGLLVEGERRLSVAIQGFALLDSLNAALPGEEERGVLDVVGREAEWEWDGLGTLRILLPPPRSIPVEEAEAVEWVLEVRPRGEAASDDPPPDAWNDDGVGGAAGSYDADGSGEAEGEGGDQGAEA